MLIYVKDNIEIFDYSLDKEDMEQIAKLDTGYRKNHLTDEILIEFENWKCPYESK